MARRRKFSLRELLQAEERALFRQVSASTFAVAVLLVGSGIAAVTALVYVTGGIAYVYAEAMYLPILLAAYLLGFPGGVTAGVVAGIALGPYMPILVDEGLMQDSFNWGFRLVAFALIGGIAGSVRTYLRRQLFRNMQLSRTDESTLLPNASAFMRRGEIVLRHSDERCVVALLLISNEQELVNTFGTSAGDALLSQIAARISERFPGLPQSPSVLRSRELAFIASESEVSPRYLAPILKSLIIEPVPFENFALYADVAVGVAIYPEHGESIENLVSRARISATAAQVRGSGHEVYRRELDRTSRENLSLLGELPGALASGQMSLYYQPKIVPATREAIGTEALIRWSHPLRGAVPPGAFIDQVEDTRLVDQLTEWVLHEAARQARRWREIGICLPVAVNISARNLRRPDITYLVSHCLEVEGLPANALELEVTERALMHDVDTGLRTLEALGELGVRLYIDDYGTGHCSLAYLKQLPIHALKIDKAFVASMRSNVRDREIVATTCNMCHRLGLSCVAEGVEDIETLDDLADLTVDEAQGYAIARPAPASEVADFLLRSSAPL